MGNIKLLNQSEFYLSSIMSTGSVKNITVPEMANEFDFIVVGGM